MQHQQPLPHQLPTRPQGRLLLLLLLLILTAAAVTAVNFDAIFADDPRHGNVRMGVISDWCDNGMTNLDKDWNGRSKKEFTCTPSLQRIFNSTSGSGPCLPPKWYLSEPEKPPLHMCSWDAIQYDEPLPTSGPHRPLWPVWGRYSYVPPQRWLHSLEHGGIVAIYHPCAAPRDVAAFVDAVAGCLRRHVITADAERMTPGRPFALLAYQNKVLMSHLDLDTVHEFIKKFALQGPEQLAQQGQYSLGLMKRARTVSDYKDSRLCPTDRKFVPPA